MAIASSPPSPATSQARRGRDTRRVRGGKPMDVIPVIDVRHGVAVHARQGQRDRYKPVETPLARGSDPVAVARGFLALFPFRSIYAADLDGIEGRGRHEGLAARLTAGLPGVEFWIDGGISGDAAAA